MLFTISKATTNDAPLLRDMLSALYTELGEEAGSLEFLTDELIAELLANGKTEACFAYTSANEIAGLMTLTESQAIYAGGAYGLVDEMYILPPYRSMGIGNKLLEHAIAIAKERNWKRLDVTTPTEERWQRTKDFYYANGFRFTGDKMKISLQPL